MSDFFVFFDGLTSRQQVKIVMLAAAVIVLILKLVIPKIKEKTQKAKIVVSSGHNNGKEYMAQGYDALRNGEVEKAVSLFETGLHAGADNLVAYETVMDYYGNIKQYHKLLYWGNHAVEKGVYDNDILQSMIDIYEVSGEEDKIAELQKLMR